MSSTHGRAARGATAAFCWFNGLRCACVQYTQPQQPAPPSERRPGRHWLSGLRIHKLRPEGKNPAAGLSILWPSDS